MSGIKIDVGKLKRQHVSTLRHHISFQCRSNRCRCFICLSYGQLL